MVRRPWLRKTRLLAGRPTPPTALDVEPFVPGDDNFVGAPTVLARALLGAGGALVGPAITSVGPGSTATGGAGPISSSGELTTSRGTGGGSMPLPS
jgi:hypothetical protein